MRRRTNEQIGIANLKVRAFEDYQGHTGMRVLHLDTERTWRGGEQQMCYLALGMQERGHAAHVVCRPASPCCERAKQMGLQVHPLPIRGDLDVVAAWRLARLADRLDMDILHAHTSRAHLAAVWAKRFSRRPLRCVVHRRVDFSIHKLPLRLSGLKYRSGVDRYIAITTAVKDVMTADGIPSERIAVVHSSTDLRRFDGVGRKAGLRPELGVPEGARLVGNIAAFVGHKGQKYLLDAVPEVLKEFPETFFLIIGDGALRGALEAQAEALEIGQRVVMPGFRDDIPHCLAEFDVFCMSSWAEGMGSVVLEAMAMRLPVVATRAGGLVELVSDGENGTLVAPRDGRALAEGICRLLRDPELGRRMGEAGRRTVEREFTVDRMVERTLAVYEEILADAY